MSGIIDYFPLLEGGPCKRFSHPRKQSLPTSNHGSYPSPRTPASPPDWKNKSDADQGSQKWGGGVGGPWESCCTRAQRALSTRSLFNVLWKGKDASCSLRSPKSADSIPGGAVSPLTSLLLLAGPSSTAPLLSPADGTEGPIEALIGALKEAPASESITKWAVGPRRREVDGNGRELYTGAGRRG